MINKTSSPNIVASEQGFVLVVALIFLVILSLVGITAVNNSTMEMQIAANDKLQKQAFSLADGGTEAASMLLEENISCPTGFKGSIPLQIGNTEILTANFWTIETEPAVPYPSDAQRHIHIPYNDAAPPAPPAPHTNLNFFGNSSLSTGNAIQMIAGYEGTGYSAATGGGQLVTNIDSQRIGENNSLSSIRSMWRHIIGHEGTCLY
jgi:hypothetical protein